MMRAVLALALVLAAALARPAASADDAGVRLYSKMAAYEDVKFDLTNAIAARGLSVELNGQIASMLERTGKDVGSTKEIYARAEFFSFCSAVFSRRMMEADPGNIAFCPFVIFLYEPAGKTGQVTVGYRRPTPRGDNASRKALAEIDGMLDAIVKEAVQ
jgi:uncharacterized protein (DUF302 family)